MTSQNFTFASGLPCNTSGSTIIHLPQSDVDDFVARCNDICKFVHGNGNPDLAGVGVVLSYAMQLALANIFGPLLHFCSHILPAFRTSHNSKRFTTWLKQHQELNLWSQLLFAFSLSLACVIREYKKSVPVYDSAIIQSVVMITLTSVLLSSTAMYQRIKRSALFGLGLIANIIFTIFASFGPLIKGHPVDPILQACVNVSKTQNLPWSDGGVTPYKFPEFYAVTFPYVGLMGISLCTWLFLLLRGGHWTTIYDEFNYMRPTVKILLMIIFLASTALSGLTCRHIYFILEMRRALSRGWNGDIEEGSWGVGQVLALFAWTPLLIEVGCHILKSGKHAVMKTERDNQSDSFPKTRRRYSV
ncbi:hypothetical protein GQ44DRAFT_273037 [Phaeosphaeriaceae sp. PMI808]|nr:hypothetical protein GQ44DRAFT_273037 [Phaeosphaeriaceae sp. PMI808]